MDPKTRNIELNKIKIESILDEWGLQIHSTNRDEKRSKIKNWLKNFAPSEISDALILLENINYIDIRQIQDIICYLAKEIQNIFGEQIVNVRFYPLGESPSSSGGMYLYDFRKELGLSEVNFPYQLYNENLSNSDILVFFDDIIGSGNQAITFAKKKLYSIKNDKYYISLYAFEEGLTKVRESNLFKQVICERVLTNEERAFHEKSYVFETNDIKERLKLLCLKYGQKLFPKHPLGYDNSQALIVFPHNTPNNSLPILWASDKNEKALGVRWNPVFERKKLEPVKFSNPLKVNEEVEASKIKKITLEEYIYQLYFKDSFYLKNNIDLTNLPTYSKLFCNFLSSYSKGILKNKNISLENTIEGLCELIISSKSTTPVVIEGLAGSGKSLLLAIIYSFLCKSLVKSKYIPVYIDLHLYERRIYTEPNINECAIALFEKHLNTILKFDEIKNKDIILIVNGADEHIKSKVNLFPILNKNKIFAKKIIGIKTILDKIENKRKILALNENDSEVILELTPYKVSLNPNIDNLLSDYSKILASNSQLNNVYESLNEKIKLLNLLELDFFILKLLSFGIVDTKHANNYRNLAQYIEHYCYDTLNTDCTSLEIASEIAFKSFNLNLALTPDYINNSGWSLIHTHQIFRNFLTARHVFNLITNSDNIVSIQDINFVYPSEVNTHIKYFIESNKEKQRTIFSNISKLWVKYQSGQSLSSLIHLAYIFGRFTELDVKSDSIQFLNKIIESESFIENKTKIIEYKSTNDSYTITDKETRKSLLFLRTVYISLIYLGDLKASDDYILFCIQNPFLENLNRGFHLEYYGDLTYLPGEEDSLLHEDELKGISFTFSKLTNKITQALEKNGLLKEKIYSLFFVDLFTLCSLVQHRFIRDECLGDEIKLYKDELNIILIKCLDAKIINRDSALMGYLLFVKKFVCSVEKMTPTTLFNFLFYLKNRHRRGWTLKAGLNKLEVERVSSHVWGAEEIAHDFIRENNPQYCKSKIIKMLHYHDIVEAFTGDLVGEEKDGLKNSNLTEKDWFRIISNFGMVDSFANMSDIFTLCNEFNIKGTEESKLANDCDKLECFLQLKNLRIRKKINSDVYNVFYNNLSEELLTQWGEIMFKKFDLLNEEHLVLEIDNLGKLYEEAFY